MKMEDTFETNAVRWHNFWAMPVQRCWWLMTPLFFRGFMVFGASYIWPEKYCSEALTLTVHQFVSDVINLFGR
jgi:hypothetical protein